MKFLLLIKYKLEPISNLKPPTKIDQRIISSRRSVFGHKKKNKTKILILYYLPCIKYPYPTQLMGPAIVGVPKIIYFTYFYTFIIYV